MKIKKRLDVLLTERGHADSRTKAQAIIMSGQVYVDGQKADKPGVSYEETMAIGDSSSDLEILKACGLGVAMGNAPDNIKAAADVVTGINTENGLAAAFEKYIL